MRTPVNLMALGPLSPTLPRPPGEDKRKRSMNLWIDAEARAVDNFRLVAFAATSLGYVAQPVRAQHS